MRLLTGPAESFFYDRLTSAQSSLGEGLEEEVEYYLVHLLTRYTRDPLHAEAFSLTFLNTSNKDRFMALKDMGDTSLFGCGLVPEHFERGTMKLSYYESLGAEAYGELSSRRGALAEVFGMLYEEYRSALRVLQELRKYLCLDGRLYVVEPSR